MVNQAEGATLRTEEAEEPREPDRLEEASPVPAIPAVPTPEACPLWGFEEIMEGMREAGVPPDTAERLVLEYGRIACLKQVRWLPFRTASGPSVELLEQAIREDWPQPRG
jgi:hypothetical protein